MEISFSHKLMVDDYKKVVIDTTYKKSWKALLGNGLLIFGGFFLLIFKATNTFGLSDKYPDYTLYLLGTSFIISPLLLFYGTIKNIKKYFNSNPNIYNEVFYTFDEEKISFKTHDGNTGTCLWNNIFDIVEDADIIKIYQTKESMYLLIKAKIEPEKLAVLLRLLHSEKSKRDVLNRFN